ncbi:hypothetical protein [Rhodoferax sp.]|uniref:hypothetical protein n=1 Tax=Rhodoferax sp. TaxID=50421 RepID=UPI0027493A56|nr:hypothetical protein [Rhodoferax sp.]
MNQSLPRTADDMLIASGQPHIYAIAVHRKSALFEGPACPAAIREWLERNCPGVTIERIKNLDDCKPAGALPSTHKTVFCLGFTDDQAQLFASAWSSPPLDSLSRPDDIFFITIDAPGSEPDDATHAALDQ